MSFYFKSFTTIFISTLLFAQTPASKYVKPDFLLKKEKATPVSVLVESKKEPSAVSKNVVVKVDEEVKSNTNAEVIVENSSGYLQVKSQSDLFNRAKVYEVVSNEQGKRKYVFTGPDGKYLVTVTSFSPETGLTEETVIVKIGKNDPIPPPNPIPNPPIVIDPPEPVIPISDKWNLTPIINEELNKIKDKAALDNIKKIGEIYIAIAKEYQNGQITNGNDAYSKLQSRIVAAVPLSTRQAVSSLNTKLNDKLKEVWATLVSNRMEMVSWLTVIGETHNKFSPANIIIKPQSINVLMLYESSDLSKPSMRQVAITINSTKIRQYLNSKNYQFKVWDKNIPLDYADTKWKNMEDLADETPTPSISIFDQDGKMLETTEIKDEQTTLALIKKWVE